MKIYLTIPFLLFILNLGAQVSYNDLREYFLQGYNGQIDENEGSPLNQFLRIDAFMKLRANNTHLEQIEFAHKANLINLNPPFRTVNSAAIADWQAIGPFKRPAVLTAAYAAGNGLFTSIELDPVNSDNFFAISAHGGVWKTSNGGNSWDNLTDFSLPSTQASDLAIDPTDPNYMYIATGDRDDYHNWTLCYGIYRSSDAGITWLPVNTGLTTLIGFASISKILIDPNNPNIIYAATSKGIFKTNDAKAACTWSEIPDPLVYNEYFRNIIFKPDGLNNTLIASGKDIIVSADAGSTWNSIIGYNTGLDFVTATFSAAPFPSRINIAVSPSNPAIIYASVIMKPISGVPIWSTQRVHHLFRFDGTSWQEKNGITYGYLTESWIAIDVSPVDENLIALGHSSGFFSSDGGSTSLAAGYTYYGGVVHPDVHEIKYSNDGNSVYFATDGGFSKYSYLNNSWALVSDGIAANTVTRIALSETDKDFMLMGAFHSGSNKFDPNNFPASEPWQIIDGGDGCEQGINPKNPSKIYVSSQKNSIATSGNRGVTAPQGIGRPNDVGCGIGITENSAQVGNYKIDPNHLDRIYVAYSDLYSYDPNLPGGSNWTKVSNLPADFGLSECYDGVLSIGISEKNSKVIYISGNETNRFFKTVTGGYDNGCNANCWTELFPPNPLPITGIAISQEDYNKVWVCYSGYDNLNKVKAYDGSTWSDYSDGLPNLPANNIVYEKGSNDALYLATDIGVYYRNASMSQWEPFIDQLPNVLVSDIEINYIDNTITAGTYGRGIWKSKLNCPLNYNLTVAGNDPFYEAEHDLYASIAVTPNYKTKFRAGDAIYLNPGFEVSASNSQEFKAYIHACNHSGNSFRLSTPGNNLEDKILPEVSNSNFVSLYPNPSDGNIQLTIIDEITTNYHLILFDISGRSIKEFSNYGKRNVSVNVASISKGIYFLNCVSDNQNKQQVFRIIIQ